MKKYLKRIAFFILLVGLISVNFAFADDCSKERKAKPRIDIPHEYIKMKNPLSATSENIADGKKLYLKNAKPAPCYRCHGESGKGDGIMGKYLRPKARNFRCKEVMSKSSDGELFWVIRKGAVGAAMAAYPQGLLPDEDLWKILLYIRSLAK